VLSGHPLLLRSLRSAGEAGYAVTDGHEGSPAAGQVAPAEGFSFHGQATSHDSHKSCGRVAFFELSRARPIRRRVSIRATSSSTSRPGEREKEREEEENPAACFILLRKRASSLRGEIHGGQSDAVRTAICVLFCRSLRLNLWPFRRFAGQPRRRGAVCGPLNYSPGVSASAGDAFCRKYAKNTYVGIYICIETSPDIFTARSRVHDTMKNWN